MSVEIVAGTLVLVAGFAALLLDVPTKVWQWWEARHGSEHTRESSWGGGD